jgi:hypothetical protein
MMVCLFADAGADSVLTGVAALSVLCGIALLGGRSVIGVPLQLFRRFRSHESRQD